jgi:hypothetical protein
MLDLAGNPVSAGDVIPVAQLGDLAYLPAANYQGTDAFQWTGSDGTNTGPTQACVVLVSNAGSAAGGAVGFTAPDFAAQFGPGALQAVQITALPQNGTLLLSDQPVAAGDIIPTSSLANLTYEPGDGYYGNDGLQWSGSTDGETFGAAQGFPIVVTNGQAGAAAGENPDATSSLFGWQKSIRQASEACSASASIAGFPMPNQYQAMSPPLGSPPITFAVANITQSRTYSPGPGANVTATFDAGAGGMVNLQPATGNTLGFTLLQNTTRSGQLTATGPAPAGISLTTDTGAGCNLDLDSSAVPIKKNEVASMAHIYFTIAWSNVNAGGMNRFFLRIDVAGADLLIYCDPPVAGNIFATAFNAGSHKYFISKTSFTNPGSGSLTISTPFLDTLVEQGDTATMTTTPLARQGPIINTNIGMTSIGVPTPPTATTFLYVKALITLN